MAITEKETFWRLFYYIIIAIILLIYAKSLMKENKLLSVINKFVKLYWSYEKLIS